MNLLINNDTRHSNMYAIVTGASSGCGYEYARIMAQKGYKLLIVSNEEAIHDKAQLLRQEFSVEVVSLVRWFAIWEYKRLLKICMTIARQRTLK